MRKMSLYVCAMVALCASTTVAAANPDGSPGHTWVDVGLEETGFPRVVGVYDRTHKVFKLRLGLVMSDHLTVESWWDQHSTSTTQDGPDLAQDYYVLGATVRIHLWKGKS